ncbi:hypothetical protein [Kitasatospora griseola]|uniref:hypothetical protein n=1 Tax=Kitasatospora griseola TaxID=2064 RepID=UPI003449BA08
MHDSWQRTVYGSVPGSPGPDPDHDYRELCGGPLDGQLIQVTDWTPDQLSTGGYLIVPGDERRADYEPLQDGGAPRWHFQGYIL